MSGMKSKLGMLAIMAAIMGEDNILQKRVKNVSDLPVITPIPKGCSRYYYNKEGICCKSEALIYFDAMKPSTAHIKYKKWLLNN